MLANSSIGLQAMVLILLFQIGLEAFGQRFELELNRNLNLIPSNRPLNIFYADKDREDIQYAASDEVNINPCITGQSPASHSDKWIFWQLCTGASATPGQSPNRKSYGAAGVWDQSKYSIPFQDQHWDHYGNAGQRIQLIISKRRSEGQARDMPD